MGSKRFHAMWMSGRFGQAPCGEARVGAVKASRAPARILAVALMGSTGLAAALLSMAGIAHAQVAREVTFNIPAGPLSSALAAFGRQSGVQITYAPELATGKSSPGVTGTVSLSAAMGRILQGTGLSHAFVGPNTVAIRGAVSGAFAEGTHVLDTIEVTSASPVDRPFETPGTTNFISGEELERFPGLTAGSIFQGTPGVISGSSNNGAAIDPNIRGLQGMNRVATTIDGSQQSSSSYRGYAGVSSRTFVDPDLISGITVTKGPDGAVGGAIGGIIAMDTLGITDILKPGDTYGVRARMGLNSNGTTPLIGAKAADFGHSDADNWSGSFAAAVTTPNVDLVAAYVQRQSGNYFAGTQGDLTTENYLGQQVRLSNYYYGQQVYNTSEDVASGLLKATVRPTDGHELQLSYLYYGNDFGEVTPSAIAVGTNVTWQIPLSSVALNQATARYHYKPDGNELVDFKVNAYGSNIDEVTVFTLAKDTTKIKQQTQNAGISAENTSRFLLASTPISLHYGGTYALEVARPNSPVNPADFSGWAVPADADREIGTLFARAKWEPLSWLTIEAGLEYLTYETTFNGTSFEYIGPEFTSYSGSGVSPTVSATVTPLPGWQLYAQYSTGIRPPSTREVSQTRNDQRFNPTLQAENAVNYEVGTNLLKSDVFLPGDKLRAKVAYFDNTTNNYIGRQFSINMSLFNYDYVRFKGAEFSGGYDAGPAFVDFGFNYYTDFEACLLNGQCMSYTPQADYLANQVPPRFTASVTAGMRFWDDRVTLGGRLTYMGQRLAPLVADPSYFSTIAKNWAPYTIVDLFGQWKINDTLTFDVSVQNLLDAYYVDALNNTDMPAPGRVIRGSLTAKLGGAEPVSWLPFGRPASNRNMPWSGLYAGGFFGYGIGQISGTTTLLDGSANSVAASEAADQFLSGVLGGVQGGYNHQFSNGFVLGLEGDFAWMRLASTQQTRTQEGPILIAANMLEASTEYSFDWLSTVRARAGYGWDRLMVYATGGVAFLSEEEERTQYRSTTASRLQPSGYRTVPFFTEVAANTRTGFAVGGGAEYAISDNWSITGSYLYAGFGAEEFLFTDARAGVTRGYTVSCTPGNRTPPCPGGKRVIIKVPGTSETVNGRDASNSVNFQLLKIGVNYRF